MMKIGLSVDEALEIMQMALGERAGLLVYAADTTTFMQQCYQARRRDPDLAELHIKPRPEGVVIWHSRDQEVQDYMRRKAPNRLKGYFT
jgi:hypothetical protein